MVIEKLKEAKTALDSFMKSQSLAGKPEDVANLKGTAAKGGFIKRSRRCRGSRRSSTNTPISRRSRNSRSSRSCPRTSCNAFRGAVP